MSKSEFAPIAQRIVNAENAFAETIQNILGCTNDEAHAIRALYSKHKITKMDAVIGRISVKHGAYLDEEVLRNALAEVSK